MLSKSAVPTALKPNQPYHSQTFILKAFSPIFLPVQQTQIALKTDKSDVCIYTVHAEKSLIPRKVVKFSLKGIIQAEGYPTGMKD